LRAEKLPKLMREIHVSAMIAELVQVRPGMRLAAEYTKRELALALAQRWRLCNDQTVVRYHAGVKGRELLLYREFVPLRTRI
jgi:hypothetical protein